LHFESDELPEFDRKVLEVLREPLETGEITISRAARQADFPANFLFRTGAGSGATGESFDAPYRSLASRNDSRHVVVPLTLQPCLINGMRRQ